VAILWAICGPAIVSDFARQENGTKADIRYRELNDRDAAIDVFCVSPVKNPNSGNLFPIP
jgi:hypothetical protein